MCEPFCISASKKKEGVHCCAYACTNSPHKRKGGLCHKHYARKRKFIDPIYTRYNKFKAKAKKRAIECSVTHEEFRAFCHRTGYIIKKGMRGLNSTIDRRCNVHGYYVWNMQLLSNRKNASKGNRFRGNEFDCPF